MATQHLLQELTLSCIGLSPDPNVEVLYISPVPVGDEVKDYYAKLLAMGPAGESAMERIHIITPDRVKTFARHNMALSSVLMYSPRTVERIRNLTAGKEAYVVPGVLSEDDLVVAEKLGRCLLWTMMWVSHFSFHRMRG